MLSVEVCLSFRNWPDKWKVTNINSVSLLGLNTQSKIKITQTMTLLINDEVTISRLYLLIFQSRGTCILVFQLY